MELIPCFNYEAFPLEQKYQWMRNGPGGAASVGFGDGLAQLAADFNASADTVGRNLLERRLGVDWQGQAATAANDALNQAAGVVAASAVPGDAGRSSSHQYGDSFTSTKNSIPAPPSVGENSFLGSLADHTFAGTFGVQSDYSKRLAAYRAADQAANDALVQHENTSRAALTAYGGAVTGQTQAPAAGAGGGAGPRVGGPGSGVPAGGPGDGSGGGLAGPGKGGGGPAGSGAGHGAGRGPGGAGHGPPSVGAGHPSPMPPRTTPATVSPVDPVPDPLSGRQGGGWGGAPLAAGQGHTPPASLPPPAPPPPVVPPLAADPPPRHPAGGGEGRALSPRGGGLAPVDRVGGGGPADGVRVRSTGMPPTAPASGRTGAAGYPPPIGPIAAGAGREDRLHRTTVYLPDDEPFRVELDDVTPSVIGLPDEEP
jgi:hypothetical protein